MVGGSKMEENKTSVLPEFKLVLAEPLYLKEPIKNIKGLINTAKIKVGLDRLSLVEMDAANISLSVFELHSSAFVEWDVQEEFVMGINLMNLSSILKNAKKEDMLVLKRNSDDKLGIELKGRTTRQFEIPIIELDEKEEKIPELKFKTKVRMFTKDLAEQIDGASQVAESVVFKSSMDKFIVSADGDMSKFKTENREDENTRIDGEDSQSKYSIEYLKKMLDISKVCNEVQLEFSNDYPLRMTFVEVDRFKLVHICAQRVED